jgi:hypothetical protein
MWSFSYGYFTIGLFGKGIVEQALDFTASSKECEYGGGKDSENHLDCKGGEVLEEAPPSKKYDSKS